MPPKKNHQKSLPKQKKEKQTKLFKNETVQDKKPMAKSRSKQFNDGPGIDHGKSN